MAVFLKIPLPSFLLLLLSSGRGFAQDGVTYSDSTHRLYYVPSVDNIDYAAVGVTASDFQDVQAYELENNLGVKIKTIAQGASLVELSLPNDDGTTRTNYLWDNVEGATYYGAGTNNFPLRRGMIVNGGVRFTVVAPEHGLYYDIDWNVTVEDSDPDEKSIVMTIVDNDETRNRASNYVPDKPANAEKTTGFSAGQFSKDGSDMSAYPTTDMTFTFKITLRKDEDFVRLRMSVTNSDTVSPKWGEAWLPMTFPINEESLILSRQRKRWRRDSWCLSDVTPNVVEWADYEFLHRPLDWPMGCIFYDIPYMEGRFHGITTDTTQGKGVVYYSPEGSEHYTKVWSWGKQGNPGNDLVGRPASDYYEAWSGGTNFAFFQTRAFKPETELSWELAILPISSGLTSDKGADELLDYVDAHIDDRLTLLGDIQGVETRTLDGILLEGGMETSPTEISGSSPTSAGSDSAALGGDLVGGNATVQASSVVPSYKSMSPSQAVQEDQSTTSIEATAAAAAMPTSASPYLNFAVIPGVLLPCLFLLLGF